MSEQRAEWLEDETGAVPDPHAPLDVRVVEAVRVQEFPAQSVTTGQVPLGAANTPVRIVAARPSRVAVRVSNRSSVAIYIGGSDQLSVGTGHQLDAGESIGLEMNGAVWAVAGTAKAGNIHWLTLNRDGLS